MSNNSERLIVGFIQNQNYQNPQLGYIKPIGEIIDNKLQSINEENFCKTMLVFITSGYQELSEKYPDKKLFQLTVRKSLVDSNEVDTRSLKCEYVATAQDASPIKSKDYFEIFQLKLPDSNKRIISPPYIPSTQYIFLDDGSNIYGPFQWHKLPETSEPVIEIDFVNAPLPGVKLAQYQTYKININKSFPTFKSSDKTFIEGLDIIQNAEFYDYASDDEIVKFCAKLATENGVRIIEPKKLNDLSQTLQKIPRLNVELYRSRLNRLVSIGNDLSSLGDEVVKSSLISFLKTSGASIVSEYVNANEAVYLEQIKKRNQEKLQEEESQARKRINDLTSEKNILNSEIQTLKEEKQKVENNQEVYDSFDKHLNEKKAQLERIEVQINEKQNLLNTAITLEQLRKDIDYFKRKHDEERDEQSKIREATSQLKSELAKADGDLQKKLTELKPYVDAINGSFTAEASIDREVTVTTNGFAQNKSDLMSRQNEVIKAVHSSLASKNRHIEEWQVTNLLISTQQSFLTILAGLPGVGKTSLARLLSESQNINPRFQEISVSRGWTSQRDLIGFFNPLTSRFQPSSTGLYDFLQAISNEKDTSKAMAYILLDEANLSPVEHYWSAFMSMTDHEGDKSLLLGQEKITIPENLRFIGTINYDGTTEPLSPRLINRAPIILLEESDIDYKSVVNQPEQLLPVSADLMSNLFGRSIEIPTLEPKEMEMYTKIKEKLQDDDASLGRPIAISPRKEIAIRQYCSKARALMNVDSDLFAFDVAIKQHLLPLIQGHGKGLGERLKKLADIIQDELPQSAKLLRRMIASGESNLHTYDYFCW